MWRSCVGCCRVSVCLPEWRRPVTSSLDARVKTIRPCKMKIRVLNCGSATLDRDYKIGRHGTKSGHAGLSIVSAVSLPFISKRTEGLTEIAECKWAEK